VTRHPAKPETKLSVCVTHKSDSTMIYLTYR
jgi:hypothetical protein